MYKNKTFLAIIPARGGSKRLPRKNILNLAGKPLISWSIEAASKSKYIDKIIVSSDDNEILQVANKYNDVEVILRPEELATDTATTIDVLIHAIKQQQKKYDYIILLQPTSPLRNEKHIDEAIELLNKKNADAVISVCEMEHSPLWSNTLLSDLNMRNFLRDELKNVRSQDLKTYYRLNGAIYICKIDKLLKENTLFLKENTFAYIMNQESSIDIDKQIDFKFAEMFLKETQNYS